MELIKDYDLIIDYHPEKANILADALSRKSSTTMAHTCIVYVPLLLDLKTLGIKIINYSGSYSYCLCAIIVGFEDFEDKFGM